MVELVNNASVPDQPPVDTSPHRLLFGRRLAQAPGSPVTTRLLFGRRLTPDPSVRFAKYF